ncbi:YfiR family protein, partial [bacterium]|nr:YfiR family protein [bacterium]
VEFCNNKKIMGVADKIEYVEQGLCLGIGVEAGKPKLIVNRQGSQDSGTNFSAQLLKLVKLI